MNGEIVREIKTIKDGIATLVNGDEVTVNGGVHVGMYHVLESNGHEYILTADEVMERFG